MMTGVSLSVTSARIALFAKSNENSLADSLVHLASGKRINTPSDSIPDFFYSQKLHNDSKSSENILRGIEEGRAFTDVASAAGETVFNAITDMRELVRRYYLNDTSDDDKAALAAEFESLKATVTAVKATNRYDGMNLVSDNGGTPFKHIALNDENTIAIDLSYTADDVADVAALTIGTTDETTESEGVATQLEKAGSYLAKTAASMHGLTAQYNMMVNKIDITSAAAERIVDADTGEEYMQSVNKSIRNQSSMTMLAQANMFRSSILRLFE